VSSITISISQAKCREKEKEREREREREREKDGARRIRITASEINRRETTRDSATRDWRVKGRRPRVRKRSVAVSAEYRSIEYNSIVSAPLGSSRISHRAPRQHAAIIRRRISAIDARSRDRGPRREFGNARYVYLVRVERVQGNAPSAMRPAAINL